MGDGSITIEPHRIIVRPAWGTGWETILDHMDQQITMQLKAIGLRLPVRRRFSYSQVIRVRRFFRQAWWSHGIFGHARSPKEIFFALWHGSIHVTERTPMPLRGFRYDVLVAVDGGKAIRLGTVNSLDVAKEIEQQCQQRFGLTKA